MKPVTVSATVSTPRQEVFEFLDVLANHEGFLDHFLTDWKFSGPPRGVGAKARARARTPGSQDWFEFEVVEAGPERIVEEATSAGGKRRTRGAYLLADRAGDGTEITFEFAWLELPRSERIVPFLTRAFLRRVNTKSMRRLAKRLEGS